MKDEATNAPAAARLFARLLECLPAAPAAWLHRAAGHLRNLGPYAAIELLLPGGSLIVILLWLYRRYRATRLEGGTAECA